MATELLNEQLITTTDLLQALVGQRGPMLEALAPVFHTGGVPAADIAAVAAAEVGWGFGGSESEAHQKLLEYFKSLLEHHDPALQTVAEAGVRQQAMQVAAAQAREREARVRGYDS